VIGPFRPIEMPVVDLADLAPADREAQALARATAEARRPFRLDQWPLLRALLLRLSPAEHVLVLVMHHVICDDWSLSVLFSDMVALYEAYTAGRPSPLGDLDVQYADYALWQRQRLQGERLERLRDHWRQRLAGVALLELPTDRPRSPQASSAGETFDTRLPAALTAQLKELGRREGATLYMTLLAAFQVLLHRYSGQDDFAVGSPVANRLRPEIEPLIGYFINMVVLRADLAGDPTFRDLLGRVRRESLDAFEHQELPFEQIVDAVNPDRHAGRHPLFQVTFTLQNAPRPEVKLAGLSFSVVPLDTGTSKFELSCTAWEEDGGLVVSVEYDSSLFRADAVRRMTRQFQTLLEGIVADPARPLSRLPLLTEAERRQVLTEWNDTARDYPTGECVLEWFEQRVRENPRATALIDGARQWTYEELDSHANRLGHFLQARGVGPDRLVAVRLRRSAELIAAVLGALKAGGAYLPIDPDAPAERVRFTLEDARAEVLVTERSLLADLPAGLLNVVSLDEVADEIALCPAEQPARQTTAEHLAYVIYTSGSTGRPKGVMIEHRALMNYTQAAIEQYGITGEDRVLQFAAASFDAHVEEIFPCLSQGGTLVLRDDNMLDAKTFLDRCRQWQLTFVTVPTGFWHELTTAIAEEGLEVPDSLRLLVIGGEAALPERVATWHRCVGTRVRLLNTYGPTETTVVATAAELGPGDGQGHRVPIGRPLGNYRAYVLDAAREPVPVGVPGELFIGGESLARGYLNRPDLTEERFVADPFAAKAGARMYKTGDVVRWRADGRLEFIGRTDHQVKIRGFRIEPGEVEQVLREHPDLADAAVMARLRAPGDLQLVAYLVGRAGTSPSPAEVRQFLRGRLPEFMVPTACVSLDALPQTPGGKVDRRALPEPDWSGDGTASQGDFVAPRTPVEQQLAALWAELLNVDRVGASDDFFDLGGNSLLTLRLASRVRQAFGVDLPPIALFRARTLAELAEQIAALRASPRAPQTPPIQPVPRESALPASFAQEPFWFLQQLLPSSNELNSHATLWITGELDVAALGDTVQEIVRRHGSLRTQFALEPSGSLVQVIVPDLRVDLPVEDVRHVPQSDRAAHVAHIARQQAAAPFDLARAPLLRVRLLRTGDEEHALLLTIHHILCDGWSLDVLNDEVAQIYAARRAGRPSPLPELPVQYADYAAWQRDYLQGATLESLLDYWRTKLDGLAPLQLPTDRPRGAAAQYRQVGFDFRVPHRVKMRLDRLCSEQAVTPHMALLAAFQVLLHRYTDSDDVAVGSVSAGRQQPEVQGLIGLFINTLVMRTDLSGDPDFRSLLARVAQTAIDAYEHQEMRFELLAKELQPGHDLMKQPLVQVLFVFQQSSTARRAAALGDLSVRSEAGADAWEAAEDFDLTFSVEEEGQGFRCQFGYDANLFDVQTIARMAAHFQTLLEAIVADPGQRLSQLSMLSQQEREQVLVEWNQTRVEYGPPCCVHQLFERQVRQTPDSVALVFEGQTITYRELNARANRLAHYLAALGVGPEVPVGVCLEPSLELAVAVLGAMKAGGIYLPLDPEDPRQRLDFFVADSRPAVVLTKSCWLDRFSAPEARVVALDVEGEAFARESGEDLPCRATPDNGVCLLYTSGSTGQPKGVVNLHRGIANYLLAKEQMAGLGPDDRVLFTTPISFDTSVEEFFFGLTCGGCLVIERAGGQKRDMRHLVELIGRERVTTACFVPSTLRLLLEEEDLDGCRWLKRVFVGGEVLTRDLLERFFRRIGAELYNEYGPTEASIDVAVWNCRLDDSRRTIPIGQPIANVRLYILDEARNPVPIGIPGELYIGGVAVARGYLNRPELNAERFLSDPFSDDGGGTMYRTGDRCRWLPDGNIEFLGRRDGQVKIHGGRLELGEVEAAIGRHPSVAQAAVVVRRSSPDYQYLAAYVVPRGRHIDDEARTEFTKELRQFLRSAVPEYMVPQAFEVMESLPKLSSGKLNRAALPDATLAARQERRYVAPRTPVEKQLAAIWAEVLRVERVGAHDNFFDLGGHSLLAVRLISQLRNALEVELPVATLFASPTLDELAEQIEQLKASGRTLEATAIPRSPRDRPVPVSYSQAPFWVISRLHPEASLYAAHPTLRFRGPLDAAALEQAFNEVLRRHEALRTTFVEQGGEVVQVIAPHQARSVPVVDLSGLPAEAREAELLRHAKAESQRPIDLAEGPLMRLQLLRLGPDEHVVLVAMHHIVYDGWSLAVLSRELVTAYLAFTSGRPSPLPDLPIQYADFAAWQRARLDGEVLDKLRGYWLKQLEGLPALELAADHARPAVRTTRVGACEHRLPRQLNQALQQLGNEQGVTKFMALLAAFEVLLHRRSSQEDFAVSTPVAGRLRPETEGLIGCFINDLVLRANLAGDPSVRQLLARVRETVLQGFEHQEMPFMRLVEEFAPPRSPRRCTLVAAELIFHNEPVGAETVPGLELMDSQRPIETEGGDSDVSLEVYDLEEGPRLRLCYSADLFEPGTAASILEDFQAVLEAMIANPQQRVSELPGARFQAVPSPAAPSAPKPAPTYVAPRSAVEQDLAAIWARLLKREQVGIHDNFFEVGGNSLLAVLAAEHASTAFGIELPPSTLFLAPTVAALAERIEADGVGRSPVGSQAPADGERPAVFEPQSPRDGGQSLVSLRVGPALPQLFCCHGMGGHVAVFMPLARALAQGRPVYALQAQGLAPGQQPHDCVEAMADLYGREIRETQPRGPYLLAGWSLGGLIALETARRIRAAGDEVPLVAMLDTYLSQEDFATEELDDYSVLHWLAPYLKLSLDELKSLPLDQQWERIAERAKTAKGAGAADIRRLAAACQAHLAAFARYQPRPYDGRVVLFRAEDNRETDSRWDSFCTQVRVETVPGNHYSMLRKPHVQALADRLDRYLTCPDKTCCGAAVSAALPAGETPAPQAKAEPIQDRPSPGDAGRTP
jgi:amino acid adenylation domain-containing protein